MRHDDLVSIAESKARVRSVVRAARSARSAGERVEAARALAAHALDLLPGPDARVSAYLSLPSEPGTDPLVERLLADGHAVVVPRIDGRRLDWVRLESDAELRRGPLGIREPVGDALPADALDQLDVLFLPGLAVDRTGIRLGQGGGYYDGALSSVPRRADGGPLRAICLFDDELLDDVPHDERDARVDCAVTPSGITWFTT